MPQCRFVPIVNLVPEWSKVEEGVRKVKDAGEITSGGCVESEGK